MTTLPNGAKKYRVEVDRIDRAGWDMLLPSFEDASFYQTWSWGAVRQGEENLSHLLLMDGEKAVAAAQVWIKKIPLLGGIAYAKYAPLWRRSGEGEDPVIFRCIVRAMKDEYATRRGLMLRIMPNALCMDAEKMFQILYKKGFKKTKIAQPYRTLVVDLSHSLEDLRKSMKKQWRKNLKASEKEPLSASSGRNDKLMEKALALYDEMRKIKKFAEFLDPNEVAEVHRDLPENMKMEVAICEQDGEPVATLVLGGPGATCQSMISATNMKGRETQSSYLLDWWVVDMLKSRGYNWYDLGGIDPERYPTTYSFKEGLSGKLGRDITFEQFDYCESIPSQITVLTADFLKHKYRLLREYIENR